MSAETHRLQAPATAEARVFFFDPDFRRQPKTGNYCCVCGKDFSGEPKSAVWVDPVSCWTAAVHPADLGLMRTYGPDRPWRLGVGADCAKKFPAGFVVPWVPAAEQKTETEGADERF